MMKIFIFWIISLFLIGCVTEYNNDDLTTAYNVQTIYMEFINNKDSINYPDTYWLNKNFKLEEINKAKEVYEIYK